MRFFIVALTVSCTPHLKAEESATCDGEALDNSWEVTVAPLGLQGEGYGRGEVVPDFCLDDQFGERISLWQFYGDVILLDISTMWCGPCQQIAQDVDETWKEFRDQGFTYITMLPEDLDGGDVGLDDVQSWADEFKITAPIVADNEGYAYDVEPNQVWPVVMLIDRNMEVIADRIAPNDAAIRAAIAAAL
jgi:peroxiredoxin